MDTPLDSSAKVLAKQYGDFPFYSNPAGSYTIPARFYTDSTIHQLERESIFFCNWIYVGHISQFCSPGDYLATSICDQNLFVIRSGSDDLKAFYNVCAHRGHELLSGQGNTNLIVCPYHAWSYGSDGTLKVARNSESVVGFNKCDFSLKPIRVEEFCSMVFVNLDHEAVALKELSGDLENEIRSICPEVDNLQMVQRDVYNVQSNWKVLIDNFLECYHCAPAHKDFVDLVDMNTYRTVTRGIYSSQIAGAPRSETNRAFHFKRGDVDFGYAGWFLWPNLTIWVYPGKTNLSVLQMNPDGVGQTIEFQDWFLPEQEPTQQHRDAMRYQKDVLQPEDIALCESVQRGLRSKGYNQGRFMIDRELTELSEHAVHHFQSMVMQAIGGEIEK
ncbi:MAG: aromatic ring-hydroxylating dioxygenase subunit alpha [Gammaproteobacteria bacterium]|nr:aromatic ring-hydroxylating dioxygenase subunit alpha [Gammaproteobacteria bacterium]MCY4218971.1 aromatic ring-hydroxylating dioxygenase subunit alpha [Gammaproteobacteria bacterium]MCY4275566.1 aromatic ring-hydroxylating dioxygenase subunit alpha [Gammaproteobacteria bacterium]